MQLITWNGSFARSPECVEWDVTSLIPHNDFIHILYYLRDMTRYYDILELDALIK